MHFIIEGFAICVFVTKPNEIVLLVLLIISVVCCLLFVVCLSSIVMIMAAKRVSGKSEDSFDEIFNDFHSKSADLYKEIDNWSACINSLLTLDIRSAVFLSQMFPSSWNSSIFFRANLTSCIMVKLQQKANVQGMVSVMICYPVI